MLNQQSSVACYEKEDVVLGSLPLLSFKIGPVQCSDNISRKFAFKVWSEESEEEKAMENEECREHKGSISSCLQAEHAGMRTYYFSTDSLEDRGEWIEAMTEAARVHVSPTNRKPSEAHSTEAQKYVKTKKAFKNCTEEGDVKHEEHKPNKNGVNGFDSREKTIPATPGPSEIDGQVVERGRPPPQHPNGWGNYGLSYPSQENIREVHEVQGEPQENMVLRRGFVPRTAPERMAQRKSSMTQLQQWVNQRRGMSVQDDLRSPARYYTMNRGVPADYYSTYGGLPYMEDYPLYAPGPRPDSICSMSAAFERIPPRWTAEEQRRSLRDTAMHGMPREPQWMVGAPGLPTYYTQLEATQGTMKRLSLQPRSRSVPRSPSSLSGSHYSPVPHNFISPARSPSVQFDRIPGRLRENGIYADPSVYGMRRSLSSPKYDFSGDRRSLTQNVYHYNYPASPSLHDKMVTETDYLVGMVTRIGERSLREKLFSQGPPFDVYRDLHPTLKLNEIETTKLLDQLCEQNKLLNEQEAGVHRLRIEKDNLEASLVATHQDMELCRTQPVAMDKLQLKKESLQNQLINVRGELSQASTLLTTSRMAFEVLEDELHAIHGDLWDQLNFGGQSELVHRHLQTEFWRVQDVLEGIHKNNPSRGTSTAKHRAVSGASGSFSTNSPASPLSSVSLTSPLSPFSPVPGSHNSPTKSLAMEHKYSSVDERISDQDLKQDRQANKVGVVSPRSKSPAEEKDVIHKRNGKVHNGHISRERPKSAVFPAEIKSKMSVEEQNERIRRNQSNSVRDKRRSLNLSSNQTSANYRVIRRRLTAHEVDIKDLEAAVRGEGVESPREEIARLRRQIEPKHYDLDISKELSTPEKVLIPERYLDIEPIKVLSPEEEKEKQKKVERIKTLIAKSNLQNVVPVLDGPAEVHSNPEQKLHEQEKRIEISCTLAAEASRRSRLLSAQITSSPPASPSPSRSSGFFDSSHIMKV